MHYTGVQYLYSIAMTELDKIQERLKKISGQIKGINRMIDNGRACPDIIQQIIAVRSALASVGMEVALNESKICKTDKQPNKIVRMESLLKSLFKLS